LIQSVFCKGKHIFIEFESGIFLHNHLLMRGIWRKLKGQLLFYPEATWLGLYVGPFTICNLHGQMLKIVDQREVHAKFASLGPDAMSQPFPRDEIRRSLSATTLSVSKALLDQKIVCGVGNIAKSEVLHIAGIDPRTATCELQPVQMDRLLEAINTVLWGSYNQGGRWTRNVYHRHGQPCEKCLTVIRAIRLTRSKRTTYFCPKCQGREV
jgi:formamidopyrimidine-DNA glycosylase